MDTKQKIAKKLITKRNKRKKLKTLAKYGEENKLGLRMSEKRNLRKVSKNTIKKMFKKAGVANLNSKQNVYG